MVLNKLCLAERQESELFKKDLLHFLLMTTIYFIMCHLESGPGRRRDGKRDLDLSEGRTLFANLVCRFEAFIFAGF